VQQLDLGIWVSFLSFLKPHVLNGPGTSTLVYQRVIQRLTLAKKGVRDCYDDANYGG
jgi:hypothetical protein